MIVQLPSFLYFADHDAADDSHNHKSRAVYVKKQIQHKSCGHEKIARTETKGSPDHIDGGADDDRNDRRPDSGHGVHDPYMFFKDRVKISNKRKDDVYE